MRAVGIANLVVSAWVAMWTSPARAVPLQIDLSISYFSADIYPQIPVDLRDTRLNGDAQFYLNSNPIASVPIHIDIGVGGLLSTSVAFEPPDPCFACQLSFSFGGLALINAVADAFPLVGSFSEGFQLVPSDAPSGPPNITIPCPVATCSVLIDPAGPIFAFYNDKTLWVGDWDVTVEAATPLPAAATLFVTGLGALGLLSWRRKRKAAALAT